MGCKVGKTGETTAWGEDEEKTGDSGSGSAEKADPAIRQNKTGDRGYVPHHAVYDPEYLRRAALFYPAVLDSTYTVIYYRETHL